MSFLTNKNSVSIVFIAVSMHPVDGMKVRGLDGMKVGGLDGMKVRGPWRDEGGGLDGMKVGNSRIDETSQQTFFVLCFS